MTRVIYMDCLSTTPMDPRVARVMQKTAAEHYANPSNVTHALGVAAKREVERARERVASLLNVSADEIFFTAGATESNNIAILGAASRCRGVRPKFFTSGIEHASVLEPMRFLARAGKAKVAFLRPDREGRVTPENLAKALKGGADFLSLMAVNNELGTIHDIEASASVARRSGAVFHCDATQAVGKIEVDWRRWRVDFSSFSAHKIYGPKGVGVLYARGGKRNRHLAAVSFGGAQEGGVRPGTLNMPAIVALAEALALALGERAHEEARLKVLTESLFAKLRAAVPDVVRLSPAQGCAPGVLNVAFPDVEADVLLARVPGLALSVGSACHAERRNPSHVLKAIGVPKELLFSAVRFGLGRFNSPRDVSRVVALLAREVKALKGLGGG